MLLNKVNLLDLANKMNYCTQLTPNGRIMLKIRCISFKFELAEWLEKNAERMRKIFYEDSVKNALVLKQFLKELEEQLHDKIMDKKFKDFIFNNLVRFGPNKYGPNMLLVKNIKEEQNLFFKLKQKIDKLTNANKINMSEEDKNNNANNDEENNQNTELQEEQKVPSKPSSKSVKLQPIKKYLKKNYINILLFLKKQM